MFLPTSQALTTSTRCYSRHLHVVTLVDDITVARRNEFSVDTFVSQNFWLLQINLKFTEILWREREREKKGLFQFVFFSLSVRLLSNGWINSSLRQYDDELYYEAGFDSRVNVEYVYSSSSRGHRKWRMAELIHVQFSALNGRYTVDPSAAIFS